MRSPTTTTRLPGTRASESWRPRSGNTSAPRVRRAPERPLDGVEQVLGHVVRLDVLRVTGVLPLATAVAGEHEHAGGADRVPRRHVGELVTHHHGRAQVELELGGRAVEQPGPRLATVTLSAVRWLARARVVHAHVEAVEARASGLERLPHAGVRGVQGLLREVAARDPGLVRDH